MNTVNVMSMVIAEPTETVQRSACSTLYSACI